MGFAPLPNQLLPILDFSKEDLKPGSSSWVSACQNVRQALEEHGFFVVEYSHKLPQELNKAVFGALEELFDLPTETKMQNKYEKPLNGYVGQIPAIPLHESLGIDNPTTLEGAQFFTNLMWPNRNDHFCETILSYAKLAKEMDHMVMRMICESYGLESYYDSHIESITYLLRLLKNRTPQEDGTKLGFVNHTDKSFTTILHQDEVDALEVETKDGTKWIRIELSSPSSFVVMAGDALMAWSNGRIHSPNHRVMMSGKRSRYSLAQFSFGNGMVQVPQELVDEDHPLIYKPFDHLGLLRFFRGEGYKFKFPIKAYCGTMDGYDQLKET